MNTQKCNQSYKENDTIRYDLWIDKKENSIFSC